MAIENTSNFIPTGTNPLLPGVGTALLLMGRSATGKTTLIATLARYVYKRFGKVTHFYANDPGAAGDYLDSTINMGIIRVFRMGSRDPDSSLDMAEETIMRAAQGYWPEEFVDVRKGEVPVGVKLRPPVYAVHSVYCAQGHLVGETVELRGYFKDAPVCPTCGLATSAKTVGHIERSFRQAKGFEDVGMVAYDGLTEVGSTLMIDLSDRHARGPEMGGLKGEGSGLGGNVVSGDLILGGNNKAHYGFAQSVCERAVKKSITIPFLIAPPVWTSLKCLGSEQSSGNPIYGPDIPGRAKTAEAPRWFGTVLGTDIVEGQHRLYLRSYEDSADRGVQVICKSRASEELPEYLGDGPGAERYSGFNLGRYFELLEESFEKTAVRDAVEFPTPPGLPPLKLPADELRPTESASVLVQAPTKLRGLGLPVATPPPGVRMLPRPMPLPPAKAPSLKKEAE